MKKDKKHFDSADIFFLKIPEELSKDSLRLIDKIVSYGFKKFSPNNTKNEFMYVYDMPIKRFFWEKPEDVRFKLKGFIIRTRKGKYIPDIYIRDLEIGKEYNPELLNWYDRIVINRAVDKILNDLMGMGVIEIASERSVISFKRKEREEKKNG